MLSVFRWYKDATGSEPYSVISYLDSFIVICSRL